MLKSHLQLQMNCYSISLIKCMEKNGIHQTQTNEQSTKSGLKVLP